MTIRLEGMDKEEAWGVMMILPPGRHICEITEVEEKTSSNDNPTIVIKSEAIEGPHVGSSIKDWVVVTSTTYPKVKQILDAAGIESMPDSWDFDPTDLVGHKVAVYVQLEPKYDDPSKMVSRVKGYEAPRESEIPPDREGLMDNGAASAADDQIPF